MAIVAVNKQFSNVTPQFDANGAVIALFLSATYTLKDDVANSVLSSGNIAQKDIWGLLTAAQKTAVQTMYTRLAALAPGICP